MQNKTKILITGGSGFIGTNLVEFYKNTSTVLNLDIKKPRNPNQQEFWKKTDILNLDSLTNAISNFQPDYIFHMAARTDLDGVNLDDYQANIKGVENLIIALKSIENLRKVVFASSRLVCEIGYEPKDEFDYKPSTVYGESKIIGEKIVRESKILTDNWIIVRPTSLWGPWFDIPYKNFFDTIEKGLYFHPKNMKIYKKFGFVLNCVYILDKLLNNDNLDKKTIYLSDFEELEVKAWANVISQYYHQKDVKEIPFFILKFIANIGDSVKKLGVKNPPLTKFRLNNLITNMYFNTKEVESVVGKLPYNLNKSTEITYKWVTRNSNTKI